MKKSYAIALLMALGLAISCAKAVKHDPNDREQTKIKEAEETQDYEGAQDEDKYKE